MIIGYTTGVFDLFHIGHLNILRRAREKCDKLIVGVTTDELLKVYKNKSPIIPFEERISIVKSIKYVDEVVPQENMDKLSHWDNLKFNEDGIVEVQRKFFGTLYNTYSFFSLYANIDAFSYSEKEIPIKKRSEIDRWIIS